jgi:N-acetylmuramoyl-L-alanine amidase
MPQRNVSRRSALIAGAVGLAALPFAGSAAQAQEVSPFLNRKIYLDPGHGGDDPGAVANGLREKDLTLDIAKRTKAILDDHGYQTRMSRSSDVTRSLAYRVNDANSWGADVFLSIHINSGGGTGFESYRIPNATNHTRTFHSNVHRRTIAWMRETATITDRGTKEANFYVLVHTNMSAVLTENLFIDTDSNANLLRSPNFRQDVAIGHFYGIENFFN